MAESRWGDFLASRRSKQSGLAPPSRSFQARRAVAFQAEGLAPPLPRQQAERAERADALLPRPSGAVGAPFPRLSGAAGADLSGLAETMVEQAERAGASLPRFSGLAKTIVEQAEQVEPAEQATRAGAPLPLHQAEVGGEPRAQDVQCSSVCIMCSSRRCCMWYGRRARHFCNICWPIASQPAIGI